MPCFTHWWMQGASSFTVLWAHSPNGGGLRCTLIPQAPWALSHSHGTLLALPTLLLPPTGRRIHPRGQACRASWIFWRQWEYFCRIWRRCSSSSRCRMRRKLCSSGMLKASHCNGAEGRYIGCSMYGQTGRLSP